MQPIRCATALALAAAVLLAACASQPLPATAHDGDQAIALLPTSDPNTLAYQAPGFDLSRYHAFLIDDAVVSQDKFADFDGAGTDDQRALAALITQEFKRVLGQKYAITNRPAPDAVRLHLTLAGLDETVPVVSTLVRLTPFGLVGTAYRSAADKPARMTGSVTISGVATDSVSGKVIGAMVSRVSPPAYNLGSGMTQLGAARLGVTRGAEQFLGLVDRLTGRSTAQNGN